MSDFSEFDDFDIIEIPNDSNSGNLDKYEPGKNAPSTMNKFADAAAENFGRILDLAQGYLNIKAEVEKGKATVAALEKQRQIIAENAEAYVRMRRADNAYIEGHLDKINEMLKYFLTYNNGQMSSSDFKEVLVAAINKGSNGNS